MLDALNIAQSGLTAAAQRLERTAGTIAAAGLNTQGASVPDNFSTAPPVRVTYLPLPRDASSNDPLEQLTLLFEDEASFKLNAAVLRTAADLARSLYDVIE
ncbi:MAG: hypothetical protein WC807_10220 [Hyphomicrobium sp.]